jgi:threonine/homoserine/homoserine lactone efflux protein
VDLAPPIPFQAAALAILPLALGSAVSPLVLVAQILTVTRGDSGLRAGWCYSLGSAVVVALWIALALVMGHALPQPAPGADPESACLRLVLALVLLGLGLRLLQSPAAGVETSQTPAGQVGHENRRHPLRRAFGLGLVTMGSNLTSLVLVFPAVHDLGRDRLPDVQEALLVGLIALFTLLPSLAPPLLLLVSGARGQRQLERLNRWTGAHQRQISGALCLGFGLLLAFSGLSSLGPLGAPAG